MDSLPPLEGLAGGDVGNELAAILRSVAEITADSGPKFTPAVCRRLARWIVCRSYAGPLRELCHLVRIAERGIGAQGFETLFWDGSAATAAAFRRRLASPVEGLLPTEAGMAVTYPDGEFAVAYTRMPFLAALMEFLISVVGYGELDALFRAGPESKMTKKAVDGSANYLARRLYGWLAPHLPSAQAQRKYRAVTAFLRRNGDGGVRADEIDDDAVLAFWIFTATNQEAGGDFRSFKTVFHLMVGVREALTAATAQAAMARARVIGSDRSAGEIDPGAIDPGAVDAALGAIHERRAPFDVLAAPPANAVKFLKRTEADALAPIIEAGDAALALPLSLLRVQVLGAAQTRISQALRRGDRAAVARLLGGDEEVGNAYAAHAAALGRIHNHLAQLLLASFHRLLEVRREEAITVMLYLRPAIDLSPLAALFDEGGESDGTVVRLRPPAAGERFLNAIAVDARRCPALADLLRDAADAARRITRKGFAARDDGAAPFAAATDVLIALRQSAGRFLDRLSRLHRNEAGWDEQYRTDRDIFRAQFRALYGDR